MHWKLATRVDFFSTKTTVPTMCTHWGGGVANMFCFKKLMVDKTLKFSTLKRAFDVSKTLSKPRFLQQKTTLFFEKNHPKANTHWAPIGGGRGSKLISFFGSKMPKNAKTKKQQNPTHTKKKPSFDIAKHRSSEHISSTATWPLTGGGAWFQKHRFLTKKTTNDAYKEVARPRPKKPNQNDFLLNENWN